jgi:hypothetical protein
LVFSIKGNNDYYMSNTHDLKKGALVKGDSHSDPSGGINTHVVGTGETVVIEGGEAIVNKTSLKENGDYTVTGTPKEIVSAVNSMDGNGVVIDSGAEMTNHATGETRIMAEGGYIPEDYMDYLWWLMF